VRARLSAALASANFAAMFLRRALNAVLFACFACACISMTWQGSPRGAAGSLLIVGGGLDNDAGHIYGTFVALASARGPANIVIASAATGPQEDEITDKTEALRVWAPDVPVRAVRRETSTEETVAAIDAATAMLFTGGDQKRITDRYRPNDTDARDEAPALARRRDRRLQRRRRDDGGADAAQRRQRHCARHRAAVDRR
jgi:hypothetical protein